MAIARVALLFAAVVSAATAASISEKLRERAAVGLHRDQAISTLSKKIDPEDKSTWDQDYKAFVLSGKKRNKVPVQYCYRPLASQLSFLETGASENAALAVKDKAGFICHGYFRIGNEAFNFYSNTGGMREWFDPQLPGQKCRNVGYTWLQAKTINQAFDNVAPRYTMDKYNALTNNCWDYADALCRELKLDTRGDPTISCSHSLIFSATVLGGC